MPGDIEIGIDIRLVGESDRTIARLNDLTKTLADLRNISTSFSVSQKEVDQSLLKVGDDLIRIKDLIDSFNTQVRLSGINLSYLSSRSKLIKSYLNLMGQEAKFTNEMLNRLERSTTSLFGALEPSEDQIKAYNESLKSLGSSGLITLKTFEKVSRGLSEVGIKIPPDLLQAIYEKDPEHFAENLLSVRSALTITSPMLREYADAIAQGIPALKEAIQANMEYERTLDNIRVRSTELSKLSTLAGSLAVSLQPTQAELDTFVKRLQQFGQEGKFARDVWDELSKGFSRTGIRLPSDVLARIWEKVTPEEFIPTLRRIQGELTISSDMMLKYGDSLEKGIEPFIESIRRNKELEESLRRVREMYRLTTATMGPVGVALTNLSQSFFWTSLGIMFSTMAYARLSRSYLNIESSQLSLIRANQSYSEALEKVRRYEEYGITTGTGYRNAKLELMEADLSLKLAQDRLANSIQQTTLSWIMFAMGTLPTVIRTTFSTFQGIMMLYYASKLQGEESIVAAIKNTIFGNSLRGLVGALNITNATLLKTIVLSGMLTLGVTTAIGAISYAITKWQVDRALEDANRKAEELGITLTKHRSPSIVESFQMIAKNSRIASESAMSLNRLGDEISTITPEASVKNVTINITGPISIRSDDDIRKLSETLVNSIRSRGASI